MAGSNLSPRQKMINMMYLVLTALLALNVSSEILQAFESLRNSLSNTVVNNGNHNVDLAKSIIQVIEKEEKGGNNKHSSVRLIVDEISAESNRMIQYLGNISDELEEIGQMDLETGELVHKEETDANYRFWLGTDDHSNAGRGNGKAIDLKEKLNGFIAWANKLRAAQPNSTSDSFSPFSQLAIEPRDDISITDPDSRSKTWEYLNFHNKPIVADLAMVEKFKLDVRGVETEMLNFTKSMLSDYVFTVDSIFAFEAPSTQVVIAGMQYQTRLLVGISSNSIQPEFIGNGISTDPGGSTATMTINANGNVIPKGSNSGIQHYRAMVKVPKKDGTFAMMPVNGEFKVQKPEVVVRSKDLQILYKDCGNGVIVDVPALGNLYNPDFSRSTGGRILKSANNRKEITIVPTAKKFNLSVYTVTNGQSLKLDDLTYKVIRPPAPRLTLTNSQGTEFSGLANLKKKSTVYVKLIPNKEFLGTLKKDCRYKANKVKLMLQTGIGSPKEIGSFSGKNIMKNKGVKIVLTQREIKQAPAGSRVYFEVEGINRINFKNKLIKENIPRMNRVFGGALE